jgi:hypothetical protein
MGRVIEQAQVTIGRRKALRCHFIQRAMSLATFETCQQTLRMSVHRGRPEVIG